MPTRKFWFQCKKLRCYEKLALELLRSVYCGIFGRSRGEKRRSLTAGSVAAQPALAPPLIQTVSMAASPVSLNVVFSFRRREPVLLLSAHERWRIKKKRKKNTLLEPFVFGLTVYSLFYLIFFLLFHCQKGQLKVPILK